MEEIFLYVVWKYNRSSIPVPVDSILWGVCVQNSKSFVTSNLITTQYIIMVMNRVTILNPQTNPPT